MRGTSANPPAEFTTITNGQQSLAPVLSETDEIGAKADLLNNQLNVNAARVPHQEERTTTKI